MKSGLVNRLEVDTGLNRTLTEPILKIDFSKNVRELDSRGLLAICCFQFLELYESDFLRPKRQTFCV